jgi:hypothetical protein
METITNAASAVAATATNAASAVAATIYGQPAKENETPSTTTTGNETAGKEVRVECTNCM